MPSMRRMRVFGVLVFTFVVYLLYTTSNARQSRNIDFYDTTKQAMNHPHGGSRTTHDDKLGGNKDDAEDVALAAAMASRLKDAEMEAKEKANSKAPTLQDHKDVIEKQAEKDKMKPAVESLDEKPPVDMSVAGRKKYPIGEEKVIPEQSPEDKDVEAELNTILKKSPIIIFSKSYCPYSKKAKHILLDKYVIVPAPYVVELDLHPKGALLQAKLAEMTGRRTVPNILVTGKSIGGGDDIEELDVQNLLVEKVKSMGGKRMSEVKKLP